MKSRFSGSSVKEAIKHLYEMQCLMQGVDCSWEKYKLYLPQDFFCSIVFFELRKPEARSREVLNHIAEGIKNLRGFTGGLILRGEGHTKEVTGKIDLLKSKRPIESDLKGKEHSLLKDSTMADSIKIRDNLHFAPGLTWNGSNFSRFAFDLVAYLQGTYEVGRLSSFHALGPAE